jgi:hypothetical protein
LAFANRTNCGDFHGGPPFISASLAGQDGPKPSGWKCGFEPIEVRFPVAEPT